jgi:hypothetical protein
MSKKELALMKMDQRTAFLAGLILIAATSSAYADSLGFVRVRVLELNADHTVKSQLSANGTALGLPFSHADAGFGWTPLSLTHLSTASDRTRAIVIFSLIQVLSVSIGGSFTKAAVDQFANVIFNDMDEVPDALRGLNSTRQCKQVEEILLWRDVDGNEFSSDEAEEFFSEVLTAISNGC